MTNRLIAPAALLVALGVLAGCANDGSLATSSSLTTSAVTPTASGKNDAACVTLAAQIDTLRREGTIDRLQQAADGKSASVQVKRAALAKQAELNKANAEFQAKCSTLPPRPSTAAVTPTPPSDAAAATKTAAAAPATAKKSAKKPEEQQTAAQSTATATQAPALAPSTSIAPTPSRAPDVIVTMPPPAQ